MRTIVSGNHHIFGSDWCLLLIFHSRAWPPTPWDLCLVNPMDSMEDSPWIPAPDELPTSLVDSGFMFHLWIQHDTT